MNKQLIAFNREKVYVSLTEEAKWSVERVEKMLTLTKELAALGYILSPNAIKFLSEKDMEDIHKDVIPKIAKEFYPAGNWKPLYPGFPAQVISKTEKELWDAQQHLYDNVDYDEFLKNNPWYTDEDMEAIKAASKGGTERVLKALTEDDVQDIFMSILKSGNSLQETTKEELVYLLDEYPNVKLPEIPFKETMCMVMIWRPDYEPKTVNDILRYGLYLMGADPALVNVPKKVHETSWRRSKIVDNPDWRKLSTLTRKNRKDILSKINAIVATKGLDAVIPDAKRFYGHWVLLSERVHPGDYESTFPEAAEFFRYLKSSVISKNYKTWNAILQSKYNSGEDILDIAKFISARPGELVRRFDSLLRRAADTGKEGEVLEIFLETEGMKNKTLTELLNYYEKRNSGCSRLVSIKGKSSKRALEPLKPLSTGMIDVIRDHIERKILLNIDKSVVEKDLTGKTVYLDPDLGNIPIPMGMRTAVDIIPPATRFNIPEEKKYIRMFIHWIQKPGRNEDLDLHAYLYKDERTQRNVGFNTGFKSGESVIHSGDVIDKPGDCTEFVDISIDQAIAEGWKYVVMDVCNFKGRGLNTLDNWLGYMTMEKQLPVGSRGSWNPGKNVDFSKKIDVKDKSMAAWIFDLEKRQAILLGIGMENMPINSGRQNQDIIKFYAEPNTFNTYSILNQYYISRGATITNDPLVEADEAVLAHEIVRDYTKVLEILG